jgi:hypothetical protein
MGIATGRILRRMRGTGRGSDYFGACELCGKGCSEVHATQNVREYRRENGQLYYSPMGGGTYGHSDCLIARFGQPDIRQQPNT